MTPVSVLVKYTNSCLQFVTTHTTWCTNKCYVPQFVITCLTFWDGLTLFIAVNFRYPVISELKRGDKVNVA